MGSLFVLEQEVVSFARRRAPSLLDRTERALFAIRRRKLPSFRFQVGAARISAVARDVRHLERLARALGAGRPERGSSAFRPHEAVSLPQDDADACIVEIPDWLAPRAADAGWLVVPKWVSHVQELSQREDVLTVPAGLELRISRSRRDLERFYAQLYLPMLERRHADLAVVTPIEYLRHRLRRGWLVLVERAGAPVAGAFVEPSSDQRLCIDVIGRADDATAPERKLVLAAAVDFARRWGFRQLDHLVSLPLVNDGLMQQKLAFDTRLERPAGSRVAYALKVEPAAYDLLHATPLVVLAGRSLAWLGDPAALTGRSPVHVRHVSLPRADALASLARRLAPLPVTG